MKYILPISLLLVGLTAGYFVGVNSNKNVVVENNDITEHITTQIVHDTVVKKEIIEIPQVDKSSENLDSVTVQNLDSNGIKLDSISEQYISKPIDSTVFVDEQIKIKTDTKLSSKKISIIYLENNSNDKDSLIKDALAINEVNNESILIEFWESPIHYSGYKLSKSKLIVFDLSPQFDYVIYKNENNYYLYFQSIYYELNNTGEFLPFVTIDKNKIFK